MDIKIDYYSLYDDREPEKLKVSSYLVFMNDRILVDSSYKDFDVPLYIIGILDGFDFLGHSVTIENYGLMEKDKSSIIRTHIGRIKEEKGQLKHGKS